MTSSALVGLIHYYELPCTPPTGIGVVPCAPGSEPGTPSLVVGGGQCEGVFISKGDPAISNAMDSFMNDPNAPTFDPHLYAVLKRAVFAKNPEIPGDYLVVFSSGHALAVDAEGITYYLFPCSRPAGPAFFVSGGGAVSGSDLPPASALASCTPNSARIHKRGCTHEHSNGLLALWIVSRVASVPTPRKESGTLGSDGEVALTA